MSQLTKQINHSAYELAEKSFSNDGDWKAQGIMVEFTSGHTFFFNYSSQITENWVSEHPELGRHCRYSAYHINHSAKSIGVMGRI